MERLFQYAVLFHPTQKEREEGKKTQLVVPPGEFKLATNEQVVQTQALRHEAITQEMIDNADRLEVAVRPF